MFAVEGFCEEDPELKVKLDFSLLTGLDTQESLPKKPEVLIYLADLNVNNSTNRKIVLHPVVLAYLHLNAPS